MLRVLLNIVFLKGIAKIKISLHPPTCPKYTIGNENDAELSLIRLILRLILFADDMAVNT